MAVESQPKAEAHQITLWIDRSPWRFLLPLQALHVSAKKLSAFLAPQSDSELDLLLGEGQHYQIQVDSDDGFQSQPTISALLLTKKSNAMGWELEFEFPNDLPR